MNIQPKPAKVMPTFNTIHKRMREVPDENSSKWTKDMAQQDNGKEERNGYSEGRHSSQYVCWETLSTATPHRLTSRKWPVRMQTAKWAGAKVRIMSHFTHPKLAQSRGPWRDIHPVRREIKHTQGKLLAKPRSFLSLEAGRKMFQDLPRGHEMICQQSPGDSKIRKPRSLSAQEKEMNI